MPTHPAFGLNGQSFELLQLVIPESTPGAPAGYLRPPVDVLIEDPLWIFSVARAAALAAPRRIELAPETLQEMARLVQEGRLDHMPPERVWSETLLALGDVDTSPVDYKPSVYFQALLGCGALQVLMPELARLHGVPQTPRHHPEVDTLVHVLMCVDTAARLGFSLPVRVATLLHDLGKGTTPKGVLPRHIGHEERGVPLVQAFCDRFKVAPALRELALIVTPEHLHVHRAFELRWDTMVRLLERMGAFQPGPMFDQAVAACLCDARGRLGLEHCEYPSADRLLEARDVAQRVPVAGGQLRERRAAALKQGMVSRQQAARGAPEHMGILADTGLRG